MTDTTTPTPDTTSTQPAARVTKEDVLAALGDTDPNRTNASAIRAILGRGGNNTIQRLLEEIRAERAAPVVTLDTVASPPAPAILVDAVWSAAWSHAQTITLSRHDSLVAERDKLKAMLEVRTADHQALLNDVDGLREALAKRDEALEQQIESEGVKLDAVGERVQRLEAELALAQAETVALRLQLEQAAERAERDLELAHRDTAQALEIAQRDAALKDAAHRSDREYLMAQVGELKSLLHHPAPASHAA